MNIPNHTIEHLILLINRFKGLSYGEYENIRPSMAMLKAAFSDYIKAADGKQEEFERLWLIDSTLSKKDFAWLTKNELKNVLSSTSFTFEEIEVLERWTIKD